MQPTGRLSLPGSAIHGRPTTTPGLWQCSYSSFGAVPLSTSVTAPAFKLSPCPERGLVGRILRTKTGLICPAAEMSADRHSPRYGGMSLTKIGTAHEDLRSDFDPDPRHGQHHAEMGDWRLRKGYGRPPIYLRRIKAAIEANPSTWLASMHETSSSVRYSHMGSPRPRSQAASPRNMSLRGTPISPRTGLHTPNGSPRGIRSVTPRDALKFSLARHAPLEVADSPLASPRGWNERQPHRSRRVPTGPAPHGMYGSAGIVNDDSRILRSDGSGDYPRVDRLSPPRTASPRPRPRPTCCTYGIDRSFDTPAPRADRSSAGTRAVEEEAVVMVTKEHTSGGTAATTALSAADGEFEMGLDQPSMRSSIGDMLTPPRAKRAV